MFRQKKIMIPIILVLLSVIGILGFMIANGMLVSDQYNTTDLLKNEETLNKEEMEELARKTLIVFAKDFDASDTSAINVKESGNIYTLTFNTSKEAETAYKLYSKDKDVIYCELDAVIETTDYEETNELLSQNGNSELAIEGHLNTSETSKVYKNIDMEEVDAEAKTKIVVIDSGATGTYKKAYNAMDGTKDVVDNHGHGTKMISIIEEHLDGCKYEIIPVKVTNDNGFGTISSLVSALDYASTLEPTIINMSLGSYSGGNSALISEYVTKISHQGTMVIVSAGNDSSDVRNYTPANIKEAIVVGACDVEGKIRSISNWGETIDYLAEADSTSQAAAFVSGWFAQYHSKNLNLDEAIKDSAHIHKYEYNGKKLDDERSELTVVNESECKSLAKEFKKEAKKDNIDMNAIITILGTSEINAFEIISMVDEEFYNEFCKKLSDEELYAFQYMLRCEFYEVIAHIDKMGTSADIERYCEYLGIYERNAIPRIVDKQYYHEFVGNMQMTNLTVFEDEQKIRDEVEKLLINSLPEAEKNKAKEFDSYHAYLTDKTIIPFDLLDVLIPKLDNTNTTTTLEAICFNFSEMMEKTFGLKTPDDLVVLMDNPTVDVTQGRWVRGYTYDGTKKDLSATFTTNNHNAFCAQHMNLSPIHINTSSNTAVTEEDMSTLWFTSQGEAMTRALYYGYSGLGQAVDVFSNSDYYNKYKDESTTDGKKFAMGRIVTALTAHSIYTGTASSTNFYKPSGFAVFETQRNAKNAVKGFHSLNIISKSGKQDLFTIWENDYTIKYNNNGGSGTMTATNAVWNKEATIKTSTFTKLGHSRNGWAKTSDGAKKWSGGDKVTNIAGETHNDSITLYQVWSPNTYTVKFDLNKGTGSTTPTINGSTSKADITATYGESFDVANPTRDGYTFNGWNISGMDTEATHKYGWDATNKKYKETGSTETKNNVSYITYRDLRATKGDVTFKAQWKANTYTVKYDGNGATGGSTSNSTHTFDVAKNLNASGFERKFTVTFVHNNGSSDTTKTATSTQTGWADSSGGAKAYNAQQSVKNLAYSGTKTIYAKWSDGTVTLPTPSSMTGYKFAGWYTANSGGTRVGGAGDTSPAISATTKYYARWTPYKLTIQFNANGGTVGTGYKLVSNLVYDSNGTLMTDSYTYDGDNVNLYNITTFGLTRTGYHIDTGKEWKTSDGSKTFSQDANSTDTTYYKSLIKTSDNTLTVYANWKVNTGTVYYYPTGLASNGKTVTGTAKSSYPLSTSGTYSGASGTTSSYSYTDTSKDLYNVGTLFEAPKGYSTPGDSTAWRVNSTTATTYLNQSSQNMSSYATTHGTVVKAYPNWTANTYTIKYNGNGSTGGSTVDSSHTYDVAQKLTKNGFKREYIVTYNYNYSGKSNTTETATAKFNGWAESATGAVKYEDEQSVTNVLTSGSTTVYANWTLNSVTLPSPTRDGYKFEGWYDAISGGNKIGNGGASYTPTKATTLYAHWTPYKLTIQFNANGGTVGSGYKLVSDLVYNSSGTLMTDSYTYDGDNVNLYNIGTFGLEKKGYHIDSGKEWTTSDGSRTFSQDANSTDTTYYKSLIKTSNNTLTVYANWKVNTYTIKYNGNGSTGGSTADSSHTYDVAQNLTKNGFERKYTVTYNYNGNGKNNTTDTAIATFNGWAESSTGTVKYEDEQSVIKLTETNGDIITLYAKWTDNSITHPTPTYTGYTFQGWYDASSGGNKIGNGGASYTPTKNITLYAHWKANNYTVKFNLNNGSGTTKAKIDGNESKADYRATYDTAFSVSSPIREGYTFEGWDISGMDTVCTHTYGSVSDKLASKTGIGKGTETLSYKNLRATDDVVTFTAKWSANTYTVSFDLNKGSGSTDPVIDGSNKKDNITSTFDVEFKVSNPSRIGYQFNGWNISDMDLTTHYYAVDTTTTSPKTSTATTLSNIKDKAFKNLKASNGTVKFVAQWTKNTYNISYDLNDSTGATKAKHSKTPANTTFDTVTTINKPTRVGYDFTGWDISDMCDKVPHIYGSTTVEKTTTTISKTTATTFNNLTSTQNGTVKFKANWKAITHDIEYNLSAPGSTTPKLGTNKPDTGTFDTNINIDNPTCVGYKFEGWYITGMDKPTEFDHIYGNEKDKEEIKEQTKATVYKNLTSVKNSTVSFFDEDANGNPRWTPNQYTVTLDLNDNDGGSTRATCSKSSITVTFDAYYVIPDASRTGYEFLGWFTEPEDGDQVISGKTYMRTPNDHTLYAHWKANTYNVEFVKNTGTGSTDPLLKETSLTATFDKEFKVENPTRIGYTFSGWKITNMCNNVPHLYGKDVANKSTTNTSMTLTDITINTFKNLHSVKNATVTFTPQWTPNNYTISFDLNKGTGSTDPKLNNKINPDPVTATFDRTININNPKREGYTFTGWKIEGMCNKVPHVHGDVTVDKTTTTIDLTKATSFKNLTSELNGNVKFTAQWQANKYTVKFAMNNVDISCREMPSLNCTFDEAFDLPERTYTRLDYCFVGWSINEFVDKPEITDIELRDAQKDVINLTSENNGVVILYPLWTPAPPSLVPTEFPDNPTEEDLNPTVLPDGDDDKYIPIEEYPIYLYETEDLDADRLKDELILIPQKNKFDVRIKSFSITNIDDIIEAAKKQQLEIPVEIEVIYRTSNSVATDKTTVETTLSLIKTTKSDTYSGYTRYIDSDNVEGLTVDSKWSLNNATNLHDLLKDSLTGDEKPSYEIEK